MHCRNVYVKNWNTAREGDIMDLVLPDLRFLRLPSVSLHSIVVI